MTHAQNLTENNQNNSAIEKTVSTDPAVSASIIDNNRDAANQTEIAEKHVYREQEPLEPEQKYSLQEVESIIRFSDTKLKLDALMTANLITLICEVIKVRTRDRSDMWFEVQDSCIYGRVYDISFYAFGTGRRAFVIIKDYDNSDEPRVIAFAYEDFYGDVGGRINLTSELQDEAEDMFSTLSR